MGEYFKPWRRKIGVLTLVMACVFAAGWVRTLVVDDILDYSTNDRRIGISSSDGEFCLQYEWMADGIPFDFPPSFVWKVEHEMVEAAHFNRSLVGYERIEHMGAGFKGSVNWEGFRCWVSYWHAIFPLMLISLWLLLSHNDGLEWQKQSAKWFVVVASIAWGILGIVSLLGSPFFLILMFVSPGAMTNPFVWSWVLNIMIIPIVCCVAVVSSRQALHMGRFKKACWLATLPLVNVAIVILHLG